MSARWWAFIEQRSFILKLLRQRYLLFCFANSIWFLPLIRACCTCHSMTTRWQHVYTAYPSKSAGRRRSALSAASDGWPTWRLRGTLLQSLPAKSPKCQTQQDQTATSDSDTPRWEWFHVTWIPSCKTRLCWGSRHWLARRLIRLLQNKKTHLEWLKSIIKGCYAEASDPSPFFGPPTYLWKCHANVVWCRCSCPKTP